MRWVLWFWLRLFEAAVIFGGFSAAIIVGVGARWMSDTAPVFIEDPDRTQSYVVNAKMHAGEALVLHRSLMRTSACSIHAGIFVHSTAEGWDRPIFSFNSVAPVATKFGGSLLVIPTPANLPAGAYTTWQSASCQRNPLQEVSVKLTGLPFEVVR